MTSGVGLGGPGVKSTDKIETNKNTNKNTNKDTNKNTNKDNSSNQGFTRSEWEAQQKIKTQEITKSLYGVTNRFEYTTYYDGDKGVGISSSGYYVELQFYTIFDVDSFNLIDALQIGGILKIGKNLLDPIVNTVKTFTSSDIEQGEWGENSRKSAERVSNWIEGNKGIDKDGKPIGELNTFEKNAYSIIHTVEEWIGNLVRVESKERLTNHITLPLPITLPSESFTVNWTNEDLGIFGALQNRRITSGTNGGPPVNVLLKPISDFFISTITGAGDEQGIIASLGTQYLNFEKFRRTQMGVKSGEPNDMLVLDDINRRQISLEWSFIPQSKKEADNLFSILNAMKQNVLPANDRNKYGISYPDFIDMKIKLNNGLYYHIKQGVVESLEIDFPKSSEGLWREDGKPFEINVKLSIQDRYRLYQNTYNDLMGNAETNYFGYNGIENQKSNQRTNEQHKQVPIK